MRLFVRCVCLCPTDSEVKSSVAEVDEFCYPGDMVSVDRDADAAVTARTRSGWFKLVIDLLSFLLTKMFAGCCKGSL